MQAPRGMVRHGRAHPSWGPLQALIAIALNIAGFILLGVVSFLIFLAADVEEFDSISEASDGVVLALVMLTLVQQAMTGGASLWATRAGWATLVRELGLDRYDWTQIWRPALMTIALYAGVAIYAAIMSLIDIDLLEPESTVDEDFVEGPLLVVGSFLMICVGAPLSEEMVFRGAIFGGLLRWGFWPAALISGFLFSGIHLDPGSLIPFWIVGVGLAWLYWSRGSMWDNIICHAMFNFTSYLLLIGGAE